MECLSFDYSIGIRPKDRMFVYRRRRLWLGNFGLKKKRQIISTVEKIIDSFIFIIIDRFVCAAGSWYLNKFSQLILHLQEKGTLAQLKRKWWNEKYSGSCQVDVLFKFIRSNIYILKLIIIVNY